MTRKQIGRVCVGKAIAYFIEEGYTVSLPIDDTQWYDLIIEKDGIFQTVQCKGTETEGDEIRLQSCGGTKGQVYDTVLNHPIDFLFCHNKNGKIWNIPVCEIKKYGCKRSITLREVPTQNKQGFQTYKYFIR